MSDDPVPAPSTEAVEAVLAEAHAEGFTDMAPGGAYRLAYVAWQAFLAAASPEGEEGQ